MEEERDEEKGGDKETSPNNNSKQIHQGSPANKLKSCKGCVYYSSAFRSNSRNPLCVGLTRSLPRMPFKVDPNAIKESKEGGRLADFKYGCVGYSIYADRKDSSVDAEETQATLPICAGLKVLLGYSDNTAVDPVPARIQNKEDAHGFQSPRKHKPTDSTGDGFLCRLSRNANVVAMGVAKNLRRVGNKIKDRLDDILNPYRRRPK